MIIAIVYKQVLWNKNHLLEVNGQESNQMINWVILCPVALKSVNLVTSYQDDGLVSLVYYVIREEIIQ